MRNRSTKPSPITHSLSTKTKTAILEYARENQTLDYDKIALQVSKTVGEAVLSEDVEHTINFELNKKDGKYQDFFEGLTSPFAS